GDAPAKRLVAYLAPRALDVTALRKELAELLPDYMVPSAFVTLDSLPLGPTGKVDRIALARRTLESTGASLRATREAPRTPRERTLHGVWKGLLEAAEIGIHENFFELGGDSILGIQVVSRAREKGLLLRPRDLFEHQTIAELALAARAADAAAEEEEADPSREVLPTPIQQWFFESVPNHRDTWALPIMLELAQDVPLAAL